MRLQVGLLGKILIALLAVGIVPLAVVSFGLIGLNRDAMTEQVLRTHAVAAQTTAQRVEDFLSVRRFLLLATAGNRALLDDPRSPATTALLSDLLLSPLGVEAVAVRNPAGEEVIRVQTKEHAASMAELMEQQEEAPLVVGSGLGAGWLRIEEPLPDGRGQLLLICDLAALETTLRPRELGEQADLVVADRSRRVVLGDQEALISYPQAMLAVALGGRLSGAARFAAPTGEILGAYAPIAGSSWIVLSRQPAGVAEQTALQLRQRSLLAVGAAFLLVFVGAATAQRSMVRPIRGLIEAQQRLAGPTAAPPAGSEIEQLLSSFELLEQRLREREELGRVFLGRYQVVEVVGAGAMGTVFRGWDPALERPVALKTVRLGEASGCRAVETAQLVEEAVAIARFNHPNIVGIYDVQQSSEVAFLAMEYVDGACLEEVLSQRGRLTASEVVALGLGIADGLAAAHARGILHRDIKPANVLVGRDGAIKIADFGISERLASLAPEDQPEAIFGTPGYIPAETLEGRGSSPKGDLFALGVTLYRLLTGRLPFPGRTMLELLHSTMKGETTAAGTLVAGVPAELDALIGSLMERAPERRCPSAVEAARRLRELAAAIGAGWQLQLSDGSEIVLEPTWPMPAEGDEGTVRAGA